MNKKVSVGVTFAGLAHLLLVILSGCESEQQRSLPEPEEAGVVREVTGASEALSRLTTRPEEETNPQLSSDGKWVLYTTKGTAPNSPFVLHKMELTSRSPFILTPTTSSNFRGVWKRDPSTGEETLVFITTKMGSPTIVESADTRGGSSVRYITMSGMGAPSSIDLNPEGREVVYSIGQGEGALLNLVDVDGGNLRSLCEGMFPRYSPDGKSIALTRSVGNVYQIFTVSASDGSQLMQTTSENDASYQPAWSPDGRHIAFITSRVVIDGKKYPHLFLMDRNGKNVRQLTDGKVLVATPHFGADGYIYFAASDANRKNENWDLYRLKPILVGGKR